jgi:hypothetical protein
MEIASLVVSSLTPKLLQASYAFLALRIALIVYNSVAIKERGGLLFSLMNLSVPVTSDPYILVESQALN